MARIGYARVSTDSQDLAAQLDELKRAGCERIFTDVASGKLAARPGLADALDYMRQGDQLVVTRLDRAARSLRHLIDLVNDDLAARGMHLISLAESIDTSTDNGQLLYQLFGVLAEFERRLIVARTHEGLAAARARGRKGGRRPAMTEDQIKLARDLYAGKKHTIKQIAALCHVSPRTIYKYLERPTND